MTLHDANGKYVTVRFEDGSELRGNACDYTSALDNPEDKASLCIGNLMFFEDEVESITEISE
ncbi:MAG: hypothetical protein RR994_01240 [Clostridia bacterium]